MLFALPHPKRCMINAQARDHERYNGGASAPAAAVAAVIDRLGRTLDA
ncbi:hypothetical protein FOFC_16890 [Fusarium oxysporum]|nr:hypothetical protein FOFC_16890 [Fusarium oxysporum]